MKCDFLIYHNQQLAISNNRSCGLHFPKPIFLFYFAIMTEKEILYTLALHLLEGVGGVKARQLISYSGSAEAVFDLPRAKLLKIPQIGERIASTLKDVNLVAQAEQELKKAQQQNTKILTYHHPEYPQRLRQIYDAPLVLFCKGNTDLNNPKSIAIVGTREATDYGKSITEEIVQDLQKHQVLVVSGLAYGIDIAAHRACLKYNLPTVGVMASGTDIIYPNAHQKTVVQMLEQEGSVLSENKLGTKPDASRFPARNRIIAGMADAVVVVEAKAKGGALITADLAVDYNKEVFAVPANLHKSTSEGCHQLIKTHKASIYTHIKDLEALLNWAGAHTQPNFNTLSLEQELSTLQPIEQKIVAVLMQQPTKPYPIDELSWFAQTPIQQVNAAVLNLEILGFVKALPGKKYILFSTFKK